jgi:hypothetical protein
MPVNAGEVGDDLRFASAKTVLALDLEDGRQLTPVRASIS